MATRNISLTRQQDAFIANLVARGEYQNASETVRDALRALQQRRREDALRLKRLRAAIKEGLDDLARGDYTDIDDLDEFFAGLTKPARRTRKRA